MRTYAFSTMVLPKLSNANVKNIQKLLKEGHTIKYLVKKSGITKYVAPYIIKPSSITCDFNKHVNPKIIQRKARHSKIETTLQYDHVSDDVVREYFLNITSNRE
jgi:site-specific recombinase XerD